VPLQKLHVRIAPARFFIFQFSSAMFVALISKHTRARKSSDRSAARAKKKFVLKAEWVIRANLLLFATHQSLDREHSVGFFFFFSPPSRVFRFFNSREEVASPRSLQTESALGGNSNWQFKSERRQRRRDSVARRRRCWFENDANPIL
jgi:hypothetical protein